MAYGKSLGGVALPRGLRIVAKISVLQKGSPLDRPRLFSRVAKPSEHANDPQKDHDGDDPCCG